MLICNSCRSSWKLWTFPCANSLIQEETWTFQKRSVFLTRGTFKTLSMGIENLLWIDGHSLCGEHFAPMWENPAAPSLLCHRSILRGLFIQFQGKPKGRGGAWAETNDSLEGILCKQTSLPSLFYCDAHVCVWMLTYHFRHRLGWHSSASSGITEPSGTVKARF